MGDRKCEKLTFWAVNTTLRQVKKIRRACNGWKCPICSPKKLKRLRAMAINGLMDQLPKFGPVGFSVKLLTLTCPGREWRKASESHLDRPYYTGLVGIHEACQILQRNFQKLRDTLQKNPRYAGFSYFLTITPQSDGYPHLHVVLVGPTIAQRRILKDIRSLWTEKYRMGSVDLQVRPNLTVAHAVNYSVKYLTSGVPEHFPKGKHFYTSTQGLLYDRFKRQPDPDWFTYAMGFNDQVFREFGLVLPESLSRGAPEIVQDQRSIQVPLPIYA